jgi:recombination protein RecA
LDIRKSGASLKDKEGNIVGNQVKVKVVKNKLAPPFRVAEFEIIFGEGINKTGEIVDLGSQFDLIQKSGAWYSYNGAKIAQGRDAAKQFLNDNPELARELEIKIKERLAEGTVSAKAISAKAAALDLLDDDGDDD